MATEENAEALSEGSDGSSIAPATESDTHSRAPPPAQKPGIDVPTDGRELDDEALRGLTEAELEQLMAALQAGRIGAAPSEPRQSTTGDSPPGTPPGFARYQETVYKEEVKPRRRILEDVRPPPAQVSYGAVTLLVVVAVVCIAALLALVLRADDPSDERLEQRCGSLRWKLDALEQERDALRRELHAAIADRERFSQEAQQLRLKKPSCPVELANQTGSAVGHLPRELAKASPLPELNCPACPPCPPPLELPAVECPVCEQRAECSNAVSAELATTTATTHSASSDLEEMDHLRKRIVLLERDNEHLRGQPERLLEDFHKQSQELWMLRAELAKANAPAKQKTHGITQEADDGAWMRRAQAEGKELRQELGSCQIELAKAQEVREKVLRLMAATGDSVTADGDSVTADE